jgi:tRNA dimethylallyltransferase
LAQESLIAVIGPTASGKTRLALDLARRTGAEIVSADMGQLYKRLDAGTAKPEGVWEGGLYRVEGIPYHMVDILDPAQDTDAGSYAAAATPLLERGKVIVVGGTGLYIRALLEGLDPLPRKDAALRERLSRETDLHARLAELDPEAAARIPANNRQRLIRALEVTLLTGKPISAQWSRKRASSAVYVGLKLEKGELERRIRERATAMFPAMLEEVRRLVPSRYSGTEPGFRLLGYPEALRTLRGKMTPEQGLQAMIASTLAYAKRQRTWFKNQVTARWLDPGTACEEVLA